MLGCNIAWSLGDPFAIHLRWMLIASLSSEGSLISMRSSWGGGKGGGSSSLTAALHRDANLGWRGDLAEPSLLHRLRVGCSVDDVIVVDIMLVAGGGWDSVFGQRSKQV